MSDTPSTLSRPLAPDAMRTRRLKTPRTVMALVLREMSTTYGRSPGGYLWAVLEPIGAVLLLSLGFSLLLRAPSLGTSFLMFYATGYLPFGLYQNVSLAVTRSLRFSRPLLAYPGVTWVDTIIARFVLNTLTQLMVFVVVTAGILALIDTRAVIDMTPLLLGLASAALLGLGIGTLNCFLIGSFPLWENIWSIVTRPLFLASGIFFIYEDMPRAAQDVLWWNPILHVTGIVRTGFYPTYEADYVSHVFVLGTAALTLAAGLLFLGRYWRDILER
jgi:capsular polysaccharide transport system permease protein